MTFINRRMIKRPTLFATSRRNFGNLLTHYETGQDGTTPDPDQTPDPVTFSTSWSTNGGIVEANLTSISLHRTTEVIVLTRDDGTVLVTLDENKVGDWDLQHDEGAGYGSYTYNIRLDGIIKSSFTRAYEPDTPTFTTNFFSNTAKTISCGIENIVNPHDSYSVRLTRLDDTILDTQVLNDASSFFLQFTESDYGSYDYKLLLSKWTTTTTSNPNIPPESYWVDTVIATHQQIFVRPEPTFTTSWTKSGLALSADLSSITNAHQDFYAYLCRDDETTLATHQFTEGQTTTSLSFTETEYGTFTYQLKLGTTVVSSHTETYVRPTPTYTASFSTNELTLSASITSITNAHNSFAITLERDDGTVLQTHTLADGETSFTFTQTETSYATFNYVLKLSGTQTDTYSAGYTPPPTPTFDIALTNEDLAITATLTDIVNPDPYYTVSFYDSSSQVASHTFSTNETGVVLNWNETTYGTKAYTIEINGASHSSHNIQLNEAVVFSDIEVLVSPQGNGDTATNITTNLSSGYTPNPPHDSAIKQRLSNNNTNTHDLANAVAWRNSDNNTDTKIIYEFPFITNVSKWEIWDARRDWTFTNYHVWFGDTEASLTKYATYSFNPTTVWNNATPNSQTRTLSPVKETKYMAFSFDDISTNPSTGQGTAGPGVAEIKIWGYPSSTVSY